ncbi:MAG: TRAP transporter substrate-binding protein [Hyphomicrobiaceae bacterium]|nr:TRAP transporter substrate-binding protein [Hyphomicrobiaceae bacterium]
MNGLSRRHALSGVGASCVAALLANPAPLRASPSAVRLKLGNDLPPAHPVNVRLSEAVAAIQAETQGAIVIELFPNNHLGGDPNMLSQVRSGALEMATFPGTVMSTLVPVMALPGIGFAYTNYDDVWASMDGALGEHLRTQLANAHLHPFEAAWDNGFRQITTSTKPILSPQDLISFKIRVPVVPLWVTMFKALQAAPVSIPLNEAYSSLQTHIADGQENPLSLISIAKFYEVQKYCSLTNHAWDGFWLVANDRVWNALPKDIQGVLAKHLNAAALAERSDIAQANTTLRKELEGHGLQFSTVEPGAFRAALRTSGFYARSRERFGEEAWSLLEKFTGRLG